MYKTILLCTDGSPAADIATAYAIWFGRKLNALVRALYVTDIRILEGPFLADLAGALGAQPYSALLPQLQQIQRERAAAILAAVETRCRERNVNCEVVHETGVLTEVMLQHEANADLVVLGQRGEHAQWSATHLGSSVERMVRASIRPCLVTPDQFREPREMLIAYDGSQESSKALRAGLELAVALTMHVSVTTVASLGGEEAASKTLLAAKQQALDHGVKAHLQLLHGNPEDEILRLCETLGADLIVMGAYGHTRIRELILGSTTSHVIRKAAVPVLLTRG
jgi:nucleotide-binding universal stress UspA family protein